MRKPVVYENLGIVLVPNPRWSWKSDLAYYFWHLPKAILSWLWFVLRGKHRRTCLTAREWLDVFLGLADCWADRWYRLVWLERRL